MCSLIVALQALKLAETSASSSKFSYGWQRAEVLGGASNKDMQSDDPPKKLTLSRNSVDQWSVLARTLLLDRHGGHRPLRQLHWSVSRARKIHDETELIGLRSQR